MTHEADIPQDESVPETLGEVQAEQPNIQVELLTPVYTDPGGRRYYADGHVETVTKDGIVCEHPNGRIHRRALL
ncbi:hypothetical protein A3A66_02340 [Microgenomates group bacterium RIFCSPLOWO2_01_FULL_46_13]|nr:MAG: hypothetical protein A2783_00570 [Microgenomates group bacterium RIFCSPHIGHO2_01_FULL_45_11]OGV94812.1 MAG: hypothetical protein A3A66_02340 [Microgenomates group bacterium RIFCSPLOWO2_01_FULL_46_13]